MENFIFCAVVVYRRAKHATTKNISTYRFQKFWLKTSTEPTSSQQKTLQDCSFLEMFQCRVCI